MYYDTVILGAPSKVDISRTARATRYHLTQTDAYIAAGQRLQARAALDRAEDSYKELMVARRDAGMALQDMTTRALLLRLAQKRRELASPQRTRRPF